MQSLPKFDNSLDLFMEMFDGSNKVYFQMT